MTSKDSAAVLGAAPQYSLPRIIATVFMPFAGGYFLSYLYRSVNAVIAPNLTSEIGLGAADLGLLTSAYFMSFAAFQIPLGVLLDRFGPRKVQACLLLAAVLGAFVFSLGDSKSMLILGRALIGLGVAGCLMASFKAIVLWFPENRWALVNGCFMSMGGLGALSATTPIEALLQISNWRDIFFGLSLVTLAVSLLIFFVVPERPRSDKAATPPSLAELFASLRVIYTDRLFWRIMPLGVVGMGGSMSIQGLWAGPWLRDVGGMERAAVADHLFAMNAAMTAGFVLTGLVADQLTRRGFTLMQLMSGAAIVYGAIFASIVFAVAPESYLPWILFGLMSQFGVVSYALLSQHFPTEFSARANTALNMMVFIGAFSFQYMLGAIIDLWGADAAGGYPPGAYGAAFGLMFALLVLSFLWLLAPGKVTAHRP